MMPPPKKRTGQEIIPVQQALTAPPHRITGNRESGTSPPPVLPRHVQRLHEIWLQIRGNWSWLVMVPGDGNFSTAALTQGLCQVGSTLSLEPIGFIEATDVDLDSASRLVGQLGTAHSNSNAWPGFAGGQSASAWGPPIRRAIVALENPIANPLALPVALAADGAVLCIRRGRSKLAEVRQTAEAIGQDRIRCCILID